MMDAEPKVTKTTTKKGGKKKKKKSKSGKKKSADGPVETKTIKGAKSKTIIEPVVSQTQSIASEPKPAAKPKDEEPTVAKEMLASILSLGQMSHTPLLPAPEDVVIKGPLYSHSQDNSNDATILFDPVIKKGITRLEILNVEQLGGIGIADDSVRYARNEMPLAQGQNKIVYFLPNGKIMHLDYAVEGNNGFAKGHRVSLELNMDANPRTLTIFVDDEEQKNYITKIPSAVRFWVNIFFKTASFKILKFEHLSAPVAEHGEGSKSFEWGKEQDDDKEDYEEDIDEDDGEQKNDKKKKSDGGCLPCVVQ